MLPQALVCEKSALSRPEITILLIKIVWLLRFDSVTQRECVFPGGATKLNDVLDSLSALFATPDR